MKSGSTACPEPVEGKQSPLVHSAHAIKPPAILPIHQIFPATSATFQNPLDKAHE